jgi:hypothetical protein
MIDCNGMGFDRHSETKLRNICTFVFHTKDDKMTISQSGWLMESFYRILVTDYD